MTCKEFSDQFDLLYNNINSNQAPGLDEYEKSVFLTAAQEQLVISLYNGSFNGSSFEASEEIRRYLAPLVVPVVTSPLKVTPKDIILLEGNNSYFYKLEDDVLFIVYEGVDWNPNDVGCLPHNNIEVKPITHDEYHRIKNNPFKGPNDHRVLRVDISIPDSPQQYVELISKYPIIEYKYRYIRRPKPIILVPLGEYSVSLQNNQEARQTSELNESLHERIVELAVRIAISAMGITIVNNNSNNTAVSKDT